MGQARDSLRLGLALVTQVLTMSRGQILHFPPNTKLN